MIRTYILKALVATSLYLASMGVAFSDERGDSIARSVDEAERAESSRIVMSMAIRQSEGGAPREFSVLSLENAEGDSLMEFIEPRTVRGMRILSRGNGSWVYFPSTGRVRKIGGASRSGSVQGVGGDFSYDDLGGGSWADEYGFVLTRETESAWELDGTRRSPGSAYDAVRVTVDRNTSLVTRCAFSLASEGGFYKVLTCDEFKDFGGRIRAGRMVMRNEKSGSSTEVLIREAEFGIAIDPASFDPARFQR